MQVEYKLSKDQLAKAFEAQETFISPMVSHIAPTIAPPDTSDETWESGMLEHPRDVFAYYRSKGVRRLLVQHKMMGSRGTIVLFNREEERERSLIWSRSGRAFFNTDLNRQVCDRLVEELNEAKVLPDGWKMAVLDSEILPWTLKSRRLGDMVFGRAASAAAEFAHTLMQFSKDDGNTPEDQAAFGQMESHGYDLGHAAENMGMFLKSYLPKAEYKLEDIQVHLFDILLVCGDHDAKMPSTETSSFGLVSLSLFPQKTARWVPSWHLDLNDEKACADTVAKWEAYTSLLQLGEGYVFKPMDHNAEQIEVDGNVQWKLNAAPAMKCRGKEYMRMVYGVDYDTPEQMARFKGRKTSRKRAQSHIQYGLAYNALHAYGQLYVMQKMYDRNKWILDKADPVEAISKHISDIKATINQMSWLNNISVLHAYAAGEDSKIDARL